MSTTELMSSSYDSKFLNVLNHYKTALTSLLKFSWGIMSFFGEEIQTQNVKIINKIIRSPEYRLKLKKQLGLLTINSETL